MSTSNPAVSISIDAVLGKTFDTTLGQVARKIEDFTTRIVVLGRTDGLALLQSGFAQAANAVETWRAPVEEALVTAGHFKNGLGELAEVQKTWAAKIPDSSDKLGVLAGTLKKYQAMLGVVAGTSEKVWGTENGFAKAANKAEQGLASVTKVVEIGRSLKDGLTEAWATKIPESAGKIDKLVGTLNKYQNVLGVVASTAEQAWGADNGITKAANAGKEWLATGVQAVEVGRSLYNDVLSLGQVFIQLGQSQVWTAAKTVILGAAQKAWAVGSLLVTGACQAIAGAFRVMNLAVMANPIGLTIAGIALAAGLVVANWDWVKEKLGQAWEWLKGLFSFSPLGLIIENWEPIKDFFGELWGWVEEKIGAVWQAIKDIPIIGSLFGDEESPKLGEAVATPASGSVEQSVQAAAPLGASISDLPVGRPVNVAQASADALPASASALPPRAGDGGMVLNYSPTISIAAGVQNPDAVRVAVDQGLDADKRRLRTMIREIMREEQRLAYA